MSIITLSDAQAWAEPSKLDITDIDDSLLSQVSNILFGTLQSSFGTDLWVDAASTPKLIRNILAMKYVAWIYNRTYSQNDELSAYATLLNMESDKLIAGIISGALTLVDVPVGVDQGLNKPGFYPTDSSSAQLANVDDYSLGGPKFSLGRTF